MKCNAFGMSPSPADSVEYVIQEEPDSQLRTQIIKGLVEFNTRQASSEDHQPLAIFARRSGQVVGGALGYTHWNWLYVSHLWVQQEDRGSDIGTHLLLQIEGAARIVGWTLSISTLMTSRLCPSTYVRATRSSGC